MSDEVAHARSVRLDDVLDAQVEAEARAAGITWSDFARQALAIRCAWLEALRVVSGGADPAVLVDNDLLLRLLTEVASQSSDPGNAEPPRSRERGGSGVQATPQSR